MTDWESMELGFWKTYLRKYETTLTREEKCRVEQLIDYALKKMLENRTLTLSETDDEEAFSRQIMH